MDICNEIAIALQPFQERGVAVRTSTRSVSADEVVLTVEVGNEVLIEERVWMTCERLTETIQDVLWRHRWVVLSRLRQYGATARSLDQFSARYRPSYVPHNVV